MMFQTYQNYKAFIGRKKLTIEKFDHRKTVDKFL